MQMLINALIVAILHNPVTTRVALGYIDPNTGGMLIQALATGLALITGLGLVFSRQIRMLIARTRRALRRTPAQQSRPAATDERIRQADSREQT